MNKTSLAKSLNISRSRLYQCIDLGMPTDSVESAREWRDKHIDFSLTDAYRPGGNTGGVKHKRQPDNDDDIIRRTTDHVLTELIPKMWFEQVGWLGSVLKDNGVKIKAEQLFRTQQCLLMLYMGVVDDYYGEKTLFSIGSIMRADPSDEIYPSLIERLNEILEE